uniref:Energy-coupling factor transport system substrate-specific component n=1 Tax=Candidatus Kentrum sp. MB TaxID=2138164 RepID=A0A451BA89_9GAMM|nr:MAG: energy-coupling factor transport system substrate-specific component [Candidatus Kentron sp. MB]VFK75206.1 MAG: energy-coupling factor transport system substrate-specific component [Candidatus Kentron sp. MB]
MPTSSLKNYPASYPTVISVIVSCLAANVAVGIIVRKIGLPIYLDTIGTILATILLGWRWGLITAGSSVLLSSLLIWPQYFLYFATALGIVGSVEIAHRLSLFQTPFRTVWAGLLVAVVAALLSAPVTTYLFKAATFSGNDIITAFFRSMGNSLLESVIFSGFSSEPIDKVITCLIVYYTLKGFPGYILSRYHLRGLL